MKIVSVLCLTLALTVSAIALYYNINGTGGPEYGKSTSLEQGVTSDGVDCPTWT